MTFLVEREARRRDARVVELWSDTRFLDAHRLYERLGYRNTGETRDLHDLSSTTEFGYVKELPELRAEEPGVWDRGGRAIGSMA